MEFGKFREPTPTVYQNIPVDEWTSRLHTVCGFFQPQPHAGVHCVTGTVDLLLAGGMEFAHIANNLALIRRDIQDIRRDYGENLFLLLPLDGKCAIEQHGRQTAIAPGDCFLVDSSSPSIFHFEGDFSNVLSVHLPRRIFFSDRSTRIDISRRVSDDDPMSSVLRALAAKLMKTDNADKQASQLRQLLFNATRQAFASNTTGNLATLSDCAEHRVGIAQVLIDRHLTERHLTPQWLASHIGVSLRTLQDNFGSLGTTVNAMIRMRRLQHARDQLALVRKGGDTTIAEVAYRSGFNDLSYFNLTAS